MKGDADYNKDGYVTGSELGMYLETSVINYSQGSQWVDTTISLRLREGLTRCEE